ncbi:hypothetical protein [Rhodococcus sp. SGAir0479]|uniref:hypothetical protein n=1 Tax=Rhodococcus sp. SGAir0479 TaxID=2567884 RepID=UPI001585DC8D|nr:hypothetical protein [Rhodococcus sp. SGAir0479]
MSTVVTLICMALLAGFVYYYLPPDRPRRLFRLEQFRPAAPLAGILDEPERPDDAVDASGGAPIPGQASTTVLD